MNSIQYITNQVGRVIGTPLQSRVFFSSSGSTAETKKDPDGISDSPNCSNDSSNFIRIPITTFTRPQRAARSWGLQPYSSIAATETTKDRAGIIQETQELNEITEPLNLSKFSSSRFDVEDTEPDETQYDVNLSNQDYEVRTVEVENELVIALLYIPKLLLKIIFAPFFMIFLLFKDNRQAQRSSSSDPPTVSNADRSAYLSILMLFIRPFVWSSTPQPCYNSAVATEHKKEAPHLYDVLEEESGNPGTISRNPQSQYSGFRPPLPGAHNKQPVTPTGSTKPRLYKSKSPSSYALRYPRHLAPPRPLIPSPISLSSQSVMYEKKTLVLDLDETLIHSLFRPSLGYGKGHMIEVKLFNNDFLTLLSVLKRPYCHEFLDAVSQWYNLVVYTASVQSYADPVIDWLEKDRKYFQRRFYRQHCVFHSPPATPNNEPAASCTPTRVADTQPAADEDLDARPLPPGRSPKNSGYVKDLGQVESNLAKVLIIDNSPIAFKNHVSNAIEIETWINDPSDTCLLSLIPILSALRFTTDVRTVLRLKSGEAMFA